MNLPTSKAVKKTTKKNQYKNLQKSSEKNLVLSEVHTAKKKLIQNEQEILIT